MTTTTLAAMLRPLLRTTDGPGRASTPVATSRRLRSQMALILFVVMLVAVAAGYAVVGWLLLQTMFVWMS